MVKFFSVPEFEQRCSACSISELCLPRGLRPMDVRRLETLVSSARPMSAGQSLFAQGEPLRALYVVSRGSMKTTVLDGNGLEQIVGFHYPGDLLGLDGVANDVHVCAAVSLEASEFCRIPFERLEQLTDQLPMLRRRLMRLMSRQLTLDDDLLMGLGSKSGEARLASWLLSCSRHGDRQDQPRRSLQLSMSRGDLANFLGMRIETISRLFSRMDHLGVLRVRQRAVEILDFDRLSEWAGRAARVADR